MSRRVAREFKDFIHYVDTSGDYWFLNKEEGSFRSNIRWSLSYVLKRLRAGHPLAFLDMAQLYSQEWYEGQTRYDREFNQILKQAYCYEAETEFLYGLLNDKKCEKLGIIKSKVRIDTPGVDNG